MAIDSNAVNTERVGQLPVAPFTLTDKIPHEIGEVLNQGTVQDLADTIGDYLGTSAGLAFNPTTVSDGGTLPVTTVNEWLLVGKGTFHNVGGAPDIITTEELNALTSNGEYWTLTVQIPINVDLAGITQLIRSGYMSTTPSENAIFNALAGKANLSDISGKEDISNKSGVLVYDGTGLKYPTINAIIAANFIQNLQRVLDVGGSAIDRDITLSSSSNAAVLAMSSNGILAQDGASSTQVVPNNLIVENATELMTYFSNAISFLNKTSGADVKLWMLRSATGHVEFALDPNKPAGSWIIATRDELDLKLNISDYNDRFKGVYTSVSALNTAHPTANAGDYAQVNTVGATTVDNYNWDAESNVWVIGGSGGSGATNTDMLPEGSSNLYFTTARVLATVLSGLTLINGSIVAADSILVAFGKIQKQLNDIATTYQVILTDVNFGAFINGLTSKTTPVNADSISIVDSADSNKQKKVSLTNFKAFLKTYFDTQYQTTDYIQFFLQSANVPLNTLNQWQSNGGTNFFSSVMSATHGTGTTPTGIISSIGYPLPSGFIIDEIIFGVQGKTSNTALSTLEVFIVWGEVAYGYQSNGLTNSFTLVQEDVVLSGASGTSAPKFYKKLTLLAANTVTAADLRVINLAIREKSTVNTYIFSINIKLKKA